MDWSMDMIARCVAYRLTLSLHVISLPAFQLFSRLVICWSPLLNQHGVCLSLQFDGYGTLAVSVCVAAVLCEQCVVNM